MIRGIVASSQVIASAPSGGTEDSYDAAISGFTYASKSKDVSGDENNPRGLHWSWDGGSCFVVGTGSDTVDQYNASTDWDTSTLGTSQGQLDVSGQMTSPQGIDFKNDGTVCYVIDNTGKVFQYSGDAWDIGSFTYDSKTVNLPQASSGVEGFQISQDGKTAWMLVAATSDTIYQYSLSTDHDISTATYASKSFSVGGEDTLTNDFAMFTDGSGFVTCGNSNDEVFQYSMSTNDDISTASYDSVSFDISGQEATVRGVALGDGSSGTAQKVYICGGANDTIYQYE